jgi:hypothetical protein
MLLLAGTNATYIQQQREHGSILITLDLYSHPLNGLEA